MAVVSKTAYPTVGDPKFVRVIKVVNGQFSIGLPPYVAGQLGFDCVTAKTQDEAIKLFREAINRVSESKTEVKRVIRYNVDNARKSDEGLSFGICADVSEERSIKIGEGKRITYKHAQSSLEDSCPRNDWCLYRGSKVIDWTPDREAALKKLEQMLVNVRNCLLRLNNPEEMTKLLDGEIKF